MTYQPISLPPQVETTAYVCDQCSAIVLDPVRHDAAGHAAPIAALPLPTPDPVAGA